MAQWLRSEGFEAIAPIFIEHLVIGKHTSPPSCKDTSTSCIGTTLPRITEAVLLEEMHIKSTMQRLGILAKIAELTGHGGGELRFYGERVSRILHRQTFFRISH